MTSRGEVILYVNADDDFVGVGIALGNHRVVIIQPDGTLLPEGTPTTGLMQRNLGGNSPDFMRHIAYMGDCLMASFDRCPPDAGINMKLTIATSVIPSPEQPENDKAGEPSIE
jgi:hypothetical protein